MIKTFNYYLFKLFNFLLLRLNINNKLSNFVKTQIGIQTIILQESKYKFITKNVLCSNYFIRIGSN